MRGELSVWEICRKHGINQSQLYKWNKEFMEAGKKRLADDTPREATSDEVLKYQTGYLKRELPINNSQAYRSSY